MRNRRRSSEVAFARLVTSEGMTYLNLRTGARIEVLPMDLDFSDFDQLRGDREAIAAFDPGYVALHELAHAVLSLRDDKTSAQGLGDCETYINRIRGELELPERQHYTTRVRKTTLGVRTAEVLFIQREQDKTRRFYLKWEIDQVGGQVGEQVGGIVERTRLADSHKRDSSMITKR